MFVMYSAIIRLSVSTKEGIALHALDAILGQLSAVSAYYSQLPFNFEACICVHGSTLRTSFSTIAPDDTPSGHDRPGMPHRMVGARKVAMVPSSGGHAQRFRVLRWGVTLLLFPSMSC